MTALRALPVRVTPYPRETPDSYAIRLCRRNGLTWREFWGQVHRADPTSANVTNGVFTRVPDVLCLLGEIDAREHPQLTKRWTCNRYCVKNLELCNNWHRPTDVSRMCRRCSYGDKVDVFGAPGPVCVRHARWHQDGLDLDVTAFPELLQAQRILNGSMRLSGLTLASPEAKFIQGMLYGWTEWGDTTARTEVPTVTRMADLPTVVRGMLLLASDEFLGLVEDESRGLARGVAVVRECLHQQQQWQVRSRIHERLRDAHDFAVGDDGRRERARVAELVGRDISTLREGDVANLQRARILENLCRAELASARLGPSERGPLRSPAAVACWEAIARRTPLIYPTWMRW